MEEYGNTVIQWVSGLGFPIAVAVYLLVYSTKEHKAINSSIEALNKTVGSLTDLIRTFLHNGGVVG